MALSLDSLALALAIGRLLWLHALERLFQLRAGHELTRRTLISACKERGAADKH